MAVHVDLVNSPYTQPPIAPHPPSHPGKKIIQENRRQMEESKRLQEFGQASKESWITRLYTHVMEKRVESAKEDVWAHKTERSGGGSGDESVQKSPKPGHLPPLSKSSKNPYRSHRSREYHSGTQHSREYRSIAREKDGSVTRPSTAGDTPQNTEPIVRKSAQQLSNSSSKIKDKHLKPLPVELAFSPYLTVKERPHYKIIVNERIKELAKAKKLFNAREKSGRRDKENERSKVREPQSWVLRRQANPYATNYVSAYTHYGRSEDASWRGKTYSTAEMEKKAKETSEKSMREGKVFTCEAPYPVDAYVRFSLRKRGWVEKFGDRAPKDGPTRGGSSAKLVCEDDEDFETICDQAVPPPWIEDHGLYAIMSRLVRHHPSRFIWGNTSVNKMIIRDEVIVNHFPKARYFSSKSLLSNSLKELPWLTSQTSHDFFPRCYVLNGEEGELADVLEDFRLTACMALLKWVLKMCRQKKKRSHLQRQNTGYEEVMSTRESDESKSKCESMFQNEPLPHSDKSTDSVEKAEETQESVLKDRCSSNSETCDSKETANEKESIPGENGALGDTSIGNNSNTENRNEASSMQDETKTLDTNVDTKKEEDASEESNIKTENIKQEDQEVQETEKDDSKDKGDDTDSTDEEFSDLVPNEGNYRGSSRVDLHDDMPGEDETEPPPVTKQNKPGDHENRQFLTRKSNITPKQKVLPDIEFRQKKSVFEVPLKSVEWALNYLDSYVRFKNHLDLDSKRKPSFNLTKEQWEMFEVWFQKVAFDGATIPMTESKLKQAEDMLRKVKRIWPQYDIDGMRNIWILKPGDKSKGVGIEFCSKVSDLSKYTTNGTTSANYVLQKYIEQPLLIYRCKFDIRQWFLVTDWNPLTVYFYKDSYLRICSQEYSYESMHEAVHLSNVAIQQFYANGQRSENLPDNNFWTSDDFQEYLSEIGAGDAWNELVYPAMKKAIVHTLLATMEVTETRKNAFELYGADFMLSEDLSPWLLEINACPGMAPSSVEKARLCASVIEDTMKVVIDKRENKNADLGRFELAYRDNPHPGFKCVDNKFHVEGSRIRKSDLQRYAELDKKSKQKEKERIRNKRKQEEEEKVTGVKESCKKTEETPEDTAAAAVDEENNNNSSHSIENKQSEDEKVTKESTDNQTKIELD